MNIALIVLLLYLLVPWSPQTHIASLLDSAWYDVIAYAAEHHFQFGTDLIFTYGPLGQYAFPAYYYTPQSYSLALGLSLAFALTLGWAMREMVTLHRWIGLVLLVAVVWINQIFIWYALPLLLLIHVRTRVLASLLVFWLAFSVLVKFSHLPTAILALLLADGYRWYYGISRFPRFSPLFVGSFLLLWLLAHQSIGTLIPYLHYSMQIMRGYSEAMAIEGPMILIVLYLLLAALGMSMIRPQPLVHIMGAVILFMAFKNGFVRYDTHVVSAFGGMAMVFVLMGLSYTTPRQLWIRILMGGVVVLALGIGYLSTLVLNAPLIAQYKSDHHVQHINDLSDTQKLDFIRFMLRHSEGSLTLPHLGNPWSQHHQESLDARYLQHQQSLQHAFSSTTTGSVDIYPWEQSYLIAHHAHYTPRPTFQSYSVYTPALIERNREFLRSDRAPKTIYFSVAEIDGRAPMMMEGATWLDLIHHYRVVEKTPEGFLRLDRRSVPSVSIHSDPPHTQHLSWGETLRLDPHPHLYASIEITPSWWGRVMMILYKAPITTMTLTDERGISHTWRIIPSIARSGFVLSPMIADTEAFATFATHFEGIGVRTIRLDTASPWFYTPTYTLHLQTLRSTP